MDLIVDTNILVSFFRPNPVQDIISNSEHLKISLYTSDYNINELRKNQEQVLKYANINRNEFEEKLKELSKLLTFVSIESCKEYESEAEKLIHDKDIPIFALALKLNCPIWSNEPLFKKQSKIDILNNREMIELFG